METNDLQIKAFSDKILLPEKKDVLRIHLYFKLLQNGIKPYENDMDIMLELYMFGGYKNTGEQNKFLDICVEKKYKRSKQSVRNTLSKYVGMKVFDKPRNKELHVNEEYIPKVECDKLVLQHIISHAE